MNVTGYKGEGKPAVSIVIAYALKEGILAQLLKKAVLPNTINYLVNVTLGPALEGIPVVGKVLAAVGLDSVM